MNFRAHNQKRLRQHAHDAAEHVLAGVDLTAFNDKERDILTDITFRLLLKYFNGRELELLGEKYLIAEASDTLLERNEEITNQLAMAKAVAEIAVALGKFFINHDTEGKA